METHPPLCPGPIREKQGRATILMESWPWLTTNPRSSSKEVRIKVPTFVLSSFFFFPAVYFSRGTLPKKETVKGHSWETKWVSWLFGEALCWVLLLTLPTKNETG